MKHIERRLRPARLNCYGYQFALTVRLGCFRIDPFAADRCRRPDDDNALGLVNLLGDQFAEILARLEPRIPPNRISLLGKARDDPLYSCPVLALVAYEKVGHCKYPIAVRYWTSTLRWPTKMANCRLSSRRGRGWKCRLLDTNWALPSTS